MATTVAVKRSVWLSVLAIVFLYVCYSLSGLSLFGVDPKPPSEIPENHLSPDKGPEITTPSHEAAPTVTPTPTPELELDGQPGVPRKIWQILFSDHVRPDQVSFVTEWLVQASGWSYSMVADDFAVSFLTKHYEKSTLDMFRGLRNLALKSDLLRYQILAIEGGFYGDLDAKPLIAMDDWVPEEYKAQARLIVAPEFDIKIAPTWDYGNVYDVQFGQWCIAGAAGHPVLQRTAKKAVERIHDLADLQGVPFDSLHPTDKQVLNATGPWLWTEVILDYLFNDVKDPAVTTWQDLSEISQPRLVGDVLILPFVALRGAGWEEEARWVREHGGERRLLEHAAWGAWRAPPS